MSAIVTSGVASFSTYLASRASHAIGRSSPSVRDARAARRAERLERVVVDLAARDDRDRFVEQAGERAEDPALRLAAQPEQDEIVARQNRVDNLRHDGLVESDDAREDRLPGVQPGNQVLADLVFHGAARRAACVHRGAQLTNVEGSPEVIEHLTSL